MIKIKILTGSVRPNRFNIQPAQWIFELAKERTDIEVELVDLKDVNLPLLDEPKTPMENDYQNDHTKAWSKIVSDADGFIFVTPEYNHSTSPVLKNAIDYLLYEWFYKPVSFVSYGSLAGGARAVEHLRGIAGELRMYDLREQLLLPNYWENLDKDGQFKFSDGHKAMAEKILDDLSFWAAEMKKSRQKLNKKA